MARFDTVDAAREAMAQARKVVGTRPASSSAPSIEETKEATGETIQPAAATKGPIGATKAAPGETTVPVSEEGLEKTQPVTVERRSATELRQRVADMNPEQMKAALLTHELTGIPNRRAYEDSAKKPAQVSVDVDSLKWLNDNAGHDSGDQLLKATAQALHEETGGNAYHISGDEFVVQGDSHEEAEAAMARAKERLAGATLTFKHPDGRTITLRGIGVSHGTGATLDEAEGNLRAAKAGRELEGERAARGEQPPNARIAAGEAGLPAGGGVAAAPKETDLAPNGKPRIRERTSWHGLPIGIENPANTSDRSNCANGKPAKRKMRVPYGEFTRTEGADGDGVDVFMGHDAKSSDKAFVIDQLDHTGKKFDEHKVVLGTANAAEAKQMYLDHYQEGWKGFGGITELDPAQLKHWLKRGDIAKPIDPESVPVERISRRSPGQPSRQHSRVPGAPRARP